MRKHPAIGTVVLVHFPFTDLSGEKRRPAIVLAHAEGNDLIVACVSSRMQRSSSYSVVIDPEDADFAQTGLREKSIICVDKLVTLDSSVLSGELGLLSKEIQVRVGEKLKNLFNL